MADFDEVAKLFSVFKAAHEHGDQFKHVRDAALNRLKEINAEHDPKKDEPAEEPVAEPALEPTAEPEAAPAEGEPAAGEPVVDRRF